MRVCVCVCVCVCVHTCITCYSACEYATHEPTILHTIFCVYVPGCVSLWFASASTSLGARVERRMHSRMALPRHLQRPQVWLLRVDRDTNLGFRVKENEVAVEHDRFYSVRHFQVLPTRVSQRPIPRQPKRVPNRAPKRGPKPRR